MKLIYDVKKHQDKIKRGIKRYGYFAEHNLYHYLYNEVEYERNVLFYFGNDRCLLTHVYDSGRTWILFPNGILAPEGERIEILMEVLSYTLDKKNGDKMFLEVTDDFRKKIIKKIELGNSLRACSNNCTLYWPIYNMKEWDPKLRGNKYKKLRNVRNGFFKRNKVKVADSKDVPKDKLKSIISKWLKRRKDHDRVEEDYYFELVDNDFKGLDIAKTMYVNGEPSTITAGWKIPNSKNYYSSIGILDYSLTGLGEVANIDDLNRLKKKGFEYVDFGGSDKVLLYFKKKFKPERIYKTNIFSIVRR